MSMLEDIKKIASEDGVELSEEMLDQVAGGAYTDEEWAAMNDDERWAAVRRSFDAMRKRQPCELD